MLGRLCCLPCEEEINFISVPLRGRDFLLQTRISSGRFLESRNKNVFYNQSLSCILLLIKTVMFRNIVVLK